MSRDTEGAVRLLKTCARGCDRSYGAHYVCRIALLQQQQQQQKQQQQQHGSVTFILLSDTLGPDDKHEDGWVEVRIVIDAFGRAMLLQLLMAHIYLLKISREWGSAASDGTL